MGNYINKKIFKDSLVCNVDIKENTIILRVTSRLDSSDIFYSCCLMQGRNVIHREKYTRKGMFNFNVDEQEYYLKVYLYNRDTGLRVFRKIYLNTKFKLSKHYDSKESVFLSLVNSEFGKVLFTKGELSFPRYECVNVDKNLNLYKLNPFDNSNWLWYLFQFQHVVYLTAYLNDVDNKNKIMDEIILCISQFIDYMNYDESEQNRMLWHDHATALRLKNITFLYRYLCKHDFFKSFKKIQYQLTFLIRKHVDFLKRDEFYSKFTNHGFDQSLYLLNAVLEFRSIFDFEDEIDLAENRIFEEIKFAFSDDGGHKENSPGYLNFGIKQCLLFIELCQNYNVQTPKLEIVKKVVDKATLVLVFLTKPNGYLACIGDTTRYKVTDIFSAYKPTDYDVFKYLISNGNMGEKPKTNSLVLED